MKLFSWFACMVTMEALLQAAEPSSGESRFIANPRQLTYEGRRSGEGYFSRDAKALVFQSERQPENPFYQIYLLDLETGDSHRVSPGNGKTTCAFFRPGTDEVLFASTHLDPNAQAKQKAELEFRAAGKERRYSWDYDEQMDIFSSKRDGSSIKRLTESFGYDAEGSYSPDGSLIVFCSLRDAFPTNRLNPEDLRRMETDPAWFGEIYRMNADGSDQRRLTQSGGYDGGPFFSPDGKRILWRHFDEKGNADVFSMGIDGSDQRRLTDFGAMSWAPYFHPSGRYVIFTANKLGFSNFELFMVDAAGEHEPVRVTYTDGFDGLPVFSPDGRRICWTSNRTSDGKSQLFLADWNDAAAQEALAKAQPRKDSSSSTASSLSHAPTNPSSATTETNVAASSLRASVDFLASDALAGRMTGSSGAKEAANFIADKLRRSGLEPFGDDKTFFHNFTFNAGVRVVTNGNHLTLLRETPPQEAIWFSVEKDFRPLSFSANGEVDGEVVFVGYGLSVPGKSGEGYDSYAGINVSNKIVLALRYVPEDAEPRRRAELNRYAGLRYKAMIAREHGARAVLFATGPNSPGSGQLIELNFDSSLAGSAIPAISISSNVLHALLAGSTQNLKTVQDALDKEDPHAAGAFVLSGTKVQLATAIEHLKKEDRNVVASIPPAPGSAGEFILVGAHYDHLGRGETGSLQHKGEEGQIHPGADDNASGTAAVLQLAAALASESSTFAANRGVIIAFWSGEEIGLIGSSAFVERPPTPLSNIVAYVNFDMVGRLRENKLTLQGVGSSSAWRRLVEKDNVAAGFNLVLQEDPYLPTDVTAFYPRKIPVLNFFTGSHEDYHRPTDRPETLNYEGLERVTRFAHALTLDLLRTKERPEYLAVSRSDTGSGSRENLRAYLGTIPDYATEVTGVKLSGVRSGGPADKGGLRAGDIIVEFGGSRIANIYDYTYAMDAAKIGQPISVVVLRDGKRVTTSVVPETRK